MERFIRKSVNHPIFGFVVLVFARLLLTWLIAPLIEKLLNRVQKPVPAEVSPDVKALHEQLVVIDLHSDPFLWNRDLKVRHRYGHVDIPRLREGNVALQVFGVATKIPWGLNFESNAANSDMLTALIVTQGWPFRTWGSLLQRSLYHAERVEKLVAEANGRLLLIKSIADLEELLCRRLKEPDLVGILLSLEGVHALEGNIDNLDILYEAGFRMIGLTHFFDNEAGGSAHGFVKGGLTPFGYDLVKRAQGKKMSIDLAHASPKLFYDVMAVANGPVFVSHTGACGTCDNPRNLTDAQLEQVARNEGVVGIAVFETAVCGKTIQDTARAMRYVVDRIGINHIALGSDFDGAITAPIDASGWALLTDALLKCGFTQPEIAQIMGGNALRILRQTLPGC